MRPKIFVWNDDKTDARKWAKVVARISDKHWLSTALTPEQVTKEYLDSDADLVVLDLLLSNNEQRGKTIARQIRFQDRLVPIIFVTRNPPSLYQNYPEIAEVDACGLFDVAVTADPAAFDDFAVRAPLTYWQIIAPDYVLARAAVRVMRRSLPQTGEVQKAASKLADEIEHLPLHGSIDLWHESLTSSVVSLLIALDCGGLGGRFRRIMTIFGKSDPFYMAAGNSRKHLSHNAEVYLLGILLLLSIQSISASAQQSIAEIDPSIENNERIWHAVGIWSCIALTHDVAYLSQHLSWIAEQLITLGSEFQIAAGGNMRELAPWSWPATHHALVGARLWLNGFPEDGKITTSNPFTAPLSAREQAFQRMIVAGVARHDSKVFTSAPVLSDVGIKEGKVTLDNQMWPQFLAVLCDELQDWLRDRSDVNKYFRSFDLQYVRMTTDNAGKTQIELGFSGNNHPWWVRERIKPDHARLVTKRFEKIRDAIEANLDAGHGFTIWLHAHLPDVYQDIDPVIIAF